MHIDGFIATQAQTVVVQEGDAPVTGRAADVIAAARTAFDAALRLIRPGKRVADVASTLQTIAESYGCSVVEGVMSHQMKQFIIDGNKCVLNKPSPETKVEDAEFEENEVYAIDIVISTGDGKPKVLDEKATTVYKRALDMEYSLKVRGQNSRVGMLWSGGVAAKWEKLLLCRCSWLCDLAQPQEVMPMVLGALTKQTVGYLQQVAGTLDG